MLQWKYGFPINLSFTEVNLETNTHTHTKAPGILSALSPTSDITSTNWEGSSVPYFLAKSSMPKETILKSDTESVKTKISYKKQLAK